MKLDQAAAVANAKRDQLWAQARERRYEIERLARSGMTAETAEADIRLAQWCVSLVDKELKFRFFEGIADRINAAKPDND